MTIHVNGRVRTFLATVFYCLISPLCFAQTGPQVSAADIYERTHSSVDVPLAVWSDAENTEPKEANETAGEGNAPRLKEDLLGMSAHWA